MAKGMFSQGVCVLLDRPASLDEIAACLTEFDVGARVDTSDQEDPEHMGWPMGGPSLTLAYRLEVNGLVVVDTVDRRWPDHMGDADQEFNIFSAWSMGSFGPFAYPGNLQRAADQCWSWDFAKTIPERHQAFVRVRSSYVFGNNPDAPVLPSDYDPEAELEFVTKVASALLNLPGALCFFNPNGEVLRDADGLRESINFAWSNKTPPLNVWSNIRLFNASPEWSLMDTVGNGQLDIPDIEACFYSEAYDFGDVESFLRNVSLYLIRNGEVIEDGNTIDGPGNIEWQAFNLETPACEPPRRVLRWYPLDDHSDVPPQLELPDSESEGEAERDE